MVVDAMLVRLHLRLVRVFEVETDTLSELRVRVASIRSCSRCPHCGFICRQVHDRRDRRVRDLPLSGRSVPLVWIRRRFGRGSCGERHLELPPEFEGSLTRRLAREGLPRVEVTGVGQAAAAV